MFLGYKQEWDLMHHGFHTYRVLKYCFCCKSWDYNAVWLPPCVTECYNLVSAVRIGQ